MQYILRFGKVFGNVLWTIGFTLQLEKKEQSAS